jgi:hypothetical protein
MKNGKEAKDWKYKPAFSQFSQVSIAANQLLHVSRQAPDHQNPAVQPAEPINLRPQ